MGTTSTRAFPEDNQMAGSRGSYGRNRDSNRYSKQGNTHHNQVPWPLTCAAEVLKSKYGWLIVVGSAALTMAAIYSTPPILAGLEPDGLIVESVKVLASTPERPELSLAVRAKVLVSDYCTRQTIYTLIKADSSPTSVYPLGQTLSGKGYMSVWPSLYDIQLSVPFGIPSGSYNLVIRSISDCEWKGVFSQRITSQAPYFPVNLP